MFLFSLKGIYKYVKSYRLDSDELGRTGAITDRIHMIPTLRCGDGLKSFFAILLSDKCFSISVINSLYLRQYCIIIKCEVVKT